jgi:hypothetical protein
MISCLWVFGPVLEQRRRWASRLPARMAALSCIGVHQFTQARPPNGAVVEIAHAGPNRRVQAVYTSVLPMAVGPRYQTQVAASCPLDPNYGRGATIRIP